MLHAFRLSPRIDYIKLPCLRRNEDGGYDVRSLGLSFDETIGLRSNIILNAVLDFKPDLILVDKKPAGVSQELRPALEMLQRRGDRPKMVLLLRDILDSPESTKSVWTRNGYHDLIKAMYDLVLVVGTREVFDLAEEYAFPQSTVEKLHYCGYLRRPNGHQSPVEVRQQLDISRESLVLVTAGGGEDGYALFWNYLAAAEIVQSQVPYQSLVILGPELSLAQKRSLQSLGDGDSSITFLEFSDDIMSLMNAADAVVSMGGYNTITEILALRKRAVIIPRVVPVLEQWLRASRMAKLGLIETIHPTSLTPDLLAEKLVTTLKQKNVSSHAWYQIELEGHDGVTYWLNRLLNLESHGLSTVSVSPQSLG